MLKDVVQYFLLRYRYYILKLSSLNVSLCSRLFRQFELSIPLAFHTPLPCMGSMRTLLPNTAQALIQDTDQITSAILNLRHPGLSSELSCPNI